MQLKPARTRTDHRPENADFFCVLSNASLSFSLAQLTPRIKLICLSCPAFAVALSAGMGGNDLLGAKEQQADQELKGANRHMLVNLALGLPLRYFRRNDDPDSCTGTSIIYDGLYYVVSEGAARPRGRSLESSKHASCTFYTTPHPRPSPWPAQRVMTAASGCHIDMVRWGANKRLKVQSKSLFWRAADTAEVWMGRRGLDPCNRIMRIMQCTAHGAALQVDSRKVWWALLDEAGLVWEWSFAAESTKWGT
jgi:hypothetical protein